MRINTDNYSSPPLGVIERRIKGKDDKITATSQTNNEKERERELEDHIIRKKRRPVSSCVHDSSWKERILSRDILCTYSVSVLVYSISIKKIWNSDSASALKWVAKINRGELFRIVEMSDKQFIISERKGQHKGYMFENIYLDIIDKSW